MPADSTRVRSLLDSIASGDQQAAAELFPLVYDELHQLASRMMSGERETHTLQTTALIHEAFLKLAGTRGPGSSYQDQQHFMATAAVVMRHILVNHARAHQTQKRGGGAKRLQIDEAVEAFESRSVDLVALDDALKLLEERDAQQHRIVELRFFGGMTNQQCADLLGISERQVYYEWAHARAWLRGQIEDAGDA